MNCKEKAELAGGLFACWLLLTFGLGTFVGAVDDKFSIPEAYITVGAFSIFLFILVVGAYLFVIKVAQLSAYLFCREQNDL